MGTIILTLPTAGTEITAGLHSSNYAALQTLLNGGIDEANLEDGAVTNAKVAAAAAIAGSKLNLAGTIVQPTHFAAGSKRTVNNLSEGPPASPSNGDIWIARNAGSNGEAWTFLYNNNETTYKWVFIGGAPVNAVVETSEAIGTADSTWRNLATSGPNFVTVRAGTYLVSWGATALGAGSVVNTMYTSVGIGDFGSSPNGVGYASNDSGINPMAGIGRQVRLTTAAGDTVRQRYRVDTGGNASSSFGFRWMEVVPIRVI